MFLQTIEFPFFSTFSSGQKFANTELAEIYFFQVGKFMYSRKIGLFPNLFKEMFLITNQVHFYNTRNSKHLLISCKNKYKTFWYKISGS